MYNISKIKLLFIILIICILTLPVFFSCHRDILDLDLESFKDQIVIEGYITETAGRQTVRISKTSSYSDSGKFIPVSGAEVYINDNAGNSEPLAEADDGHYEVDAFRGIPGRTYSLRVVYDREEYTASSILKQPLGLDAIEFYENGGCCSGLICYFTDQPGEIDYCAIKVFVNGYGHYSQLYQGRFTDGEQIALDREHTGIHHGDRVRIELYTFNKATYEYFSTLQADTDEDDFDTDLPDIIPSGRSNPKTNLSNGALGHFSAISSRTYLRIR